MDGEVRLEFNDLIEKIHKEWFEEFNLDMILIENAPISLHIIQELKKRGLPIHSIKPKASKLMRMQACAPLFSQGRIWYPKGEGLEWAKEVVKQVCIFPRR